MRAFGGLVLWAWACLAPGFAAAQDSPVIEVPAGKRVAIGWSRGRGEPLVLRFYARTPGADWRPIEPEAVTEPNQGVFTPKDPRALAARDTDWELRCDARVKVRDRLRPARLVKTDEGTRILLQYREASQPELDVTVRVEFR